jgi:hypothetical protein
MLVVYVIDQVCNDQEYPDHDIAGHNRAIESIKNGLAK